MNIRNHYKEYTNIFSDSKSLSKKGKLIRGISFTIYATAILFGIITLI